MPNKRVDLDELEQCWLAASKGPWEAKPVGSIIGHRDTAAVQEVGSLVDWICHMQGSNCPKWQEDQLVIVALHNAFPAIFAELRAARAVVEVARTLEGIHSAGCSQFADWEVPCDCGSVPLREAVTTYDTVIHAEEPPHAKA